MSSIIFTSMLFKLATALLAYIVIRIVLRRFDRIGGIRFRYWWSKADERSQAIYLSARMLGICLLFGFILSA